MNIGLGHLEPIIFFDDKKDLYNFPYSLEFTNEKIEIDFLFHRDNYKNQNELLIERNKEISDSIFNRYFFKQFESIQEICLNDGDSKDENIMNEVNERLDIMYYLFLVIIKLNKDSLEETELIETLWSLYDELLEMFILLEDLYSGIRKKEILERKKKWLDLENKNE